MVNTPNFNKGPEACNPFDPFAPGTKNDTPLHIKIKRVASEVGAQEFRVVVRDRGTGRKMKNVPINIDVSPSQAAVAGDFWTMVPASATQAYGAITKDFDPLAGSRNEGVVTTDTDGKASFRVVSTGATSQQGTVSIGNFVGRFKLDLTRVVSLSEDDDCFCSLTCNPCCIDPNADIFSGSSSRRDHDSDDD
jgi:hypothetical protein